MTFKKSYSGVKLKGKLSRIQMLQVNKGSYGILTPVVFTMSNSYGNNKHRCMNVMFLKPNKT